MTSELKAIGDKLDQLNGKVDGIKGTMDNHITSTNIYRDTQAKKLEEHHLDINGNGKPGLKTKVDRLERIEWIKNWFAGVIFVACIPVAINYFMKLAHQ